MVYCIHLGEGEFAITNNATINIFIQISLCSSESIVIRYRNGIVKSKDPVLKILSNCSLKMLQLHLGCGMSLSLLFSHTYYQSFKIFANLKYKKNQNLIIFNTVCPWSTVRLRNFLYFWPF